MKRLLPFVLALLLLELTPKTTFASHAMSAEISYACLGGDTFLVTLNFFRDCAGISAPVSATITIGSDTCGINDTTYALPLAGTREISPVCPSMISQTSCDSGNLIGIEEFVYSDTIVLPTHCFDWTLSYALCCRNDLITNIQTPGSYDLYVETHLNNAINICNNSPKFIQNSFVTCAGVPAILNLGACDPDGDSLVFSITNPLGGPLTPIPFSFSPYTFDSLSGILEFLPTVTSVNNLAVLVKEYRNGVFIGSTMSDFQILVISCNNNSPVFSPIQSHSGAVLKDSFTLVTCSGSPVSFSFLASDADTGNNLTLGSDLSNFPRATFSVSGTANNKTGNFTWTPSLGVSGSHCLIVTASDGVCPIVGLNTIKYTIKVNARTLAGNDKYFCSTGIPAQLDASGGTSFSWSPSLGLSDTAISNPLAAPIVTTTYVVTSNLISACVNSDTVTVFVVPDFSLQMSPDDTICLNSDAQIGAIADPLYAPYTYQWSNGNSLDDETIASPIASPVASTIYTATVTSANECSKKDSVTVTISGIAPRVIATASKTNPCSGDTVQLGGIVHSGTCGVSAQGCSVQNPAVAKTFGVNAFNFTGTPFAGADEDAKYQALYLASDLYSSGITPGTITEMAIELGSKASTGVYRNFTLRMGCTAQHSLTLSGWLPNGIIVFGPVNYSTVLGINNFILDTPYQWNGTDNLFIEICFDNPSLSSAGGADGIMCIPALYGAAMRSVSNNTFGCILTPTTIYQQLPKITFKICPPDLTPYAILWDPALGLSNPNILNPIASTTQTTQYQLMIDDGICNSRSFITLMVDTSYGIATSNDTTVCGAAPVQLNVMETGTPPPVVFNCGIGGGSTCSTPLSYQLGLNPSGTGTGTPYDGFWEDARVQFLYPATELISLIGSAGTITSLAFNVTAKGSTIPYSSFTIKMGCTNLNALPTSFVSSPALDVVYGPISYSTIAGWNVHTLSSPFNWDGSSSLIIEVCYDNVDWTDDDDVAYSVALPNSVLYDNGDGTNGCSLNTPLNSPNRPNIRFTFCPAPNLNPIVSWTPSNTLSDPSKVSPIANPTTTTTYHVDYSFQNGCTFSDSVTVTIIPAAVTTSVSNDTTLTECESVQLSASGGNKYQWDSIPGLSCYDCPNPIANPNITTAFPITITDTVTGCGARDSVVITVIPVDLIALSHDTIICPNSSITLVAAGGFAGYLWSTGQTTPTFTISQEGTYSITATSGACQVVDSIIIIDESGCVWPGDANNDGIANNLDVLAIGIAHSSTGPVRANATLNWVAQPAYNWGSVLGNGADYKHVDCNGDGVINTIDTLAVSLNYGLTHNKQPGGGSADPLIYLAPLNDTLSEGEQVQIPVMLGENFLPVTDFYGIAFSLSYNNSVIEQNTVRFDAVTSFAGQPGLSILDFNKDFPSSTQIDAAVTRINQTSVTGSGQVGILSFTVKDSLNWNGGNIQQLNFSFTNIFAIDETENQIAVSSEPTTLFVAKEEPIGINELSNLEFEIWVYPNPAKDVLTVESKTNVRIHEVIIFNTLGKAVLMEANIDNSKTDFDITNLAEGNYFMTVRTDKGVLNNKVSILR